MSAVEGLPAPSPTVGPAANELRLDVLPSLCPYLGTLDGNWRSARAVREHRCMAVSPPVPLAPEKQRRLCLVEAHLTCATYAAAQAARPTRSLRPTGHSRPIARMTPVILDHGRIDVRLPVFWTDRASQGILVGVLGLAFVAILLARPSGDAGATGPLGADASSSPLAIEGTPTNAAADPPTPAETTEAPAPPESPPATASPANSNEPASAAPTAGATAQPTPSGASYRVKSGDTLSAIAARFGTTPQVLTRLNELTNPSQLKVGQILKLP